MASSRKPRSADDPLAAVAASIARHVAPGARLCVGLSGGVDSVVLLHLLNDLRKRRDLSVTAAHVHHGLSPSADHWAAFCSGLCERLDIPIRHFKVRLPVSPAGGVEAAARSARYAAFSRLEADWLALGHHRDDQAETVLFRLFRGAGARGMSGIAEVERRTDGMSLLRPMLGVDRAAILSWARDRGLDWIEDESNADLRFTRNFLRKSVLPLVQERFPAAVSSICRAADHLRESQGLLDELAVIDWRAVCADEAMRFDALLRLPEERRRNLIRWALRAMGLPAPDDADLREAVRQLGALGAGQPLHYALGQAWLCRYRNTVWLEEIVDSSATTVPWCGIERLRWGGDEVVFERVRGAGVRFSCLDGRLVLLDRRRPGDRMQLAAGRPHRSIKNLVQEAGIPPWLRDAMPVLRVDGVPVWIGGVGVAHDYACPPGEDGLLPSWLRSGAAGISLRPGQA